MPDHYKSVDKSKVKKVRQNKEEKVAKRLNRQSSERLPARKVIYDKKGRAMVESGKRNLNLQVGKTNADSFVDNDNNHSKSGAKRIKAGNSKIDQAQRRIENKRLKKNTRNATAKRVAKRVGKTALRGAGPVGVAVSIFDFLKGKPAY